MSRSKLTPIARASFPNLSKPDQFNKYSLSLLIPKSDPKTAEFIKWLQTAVTEEAKAVADPNGLQQALSLFTNLKDGDKVESFATYRQEYAGHWILNVSRKPDFGRPCVVNRNCQPIDASEIYAGCNIIAFIDVYGYKYGTKKSVSVGFQHVMKTGENTPFTSAGVQVEDAFAGLEIPDEDDTIGASQGTNGLPFPTAPNDSPPPKTPNSSPASPPVSNNPFSGV